MQPRRLIGLLALVRGLHGLRHRGSEESEDADAPQFFACEWEKESPEFGGCSEKFGVPSRQMDDLLEFGYRRMRSVATSGRKPLAVHVGADGLLNSAKWTDMHLYTRVLKNSGLSHGALRLAFVEPIEAKAEIFWGNAERLPAAKGQVSLHTAMVDGHCKADREMIYRLSPMAAHTFDFDPLMTQGWVSFQPSHPLDVVGYWVRANLPICCKSDYRQDCRQNLKRFWDAPDRNSYIEGLPIPCHSLPSLVQTAGSDLRDLSMLVVDAEGLDTKILAATAEREDFLPGFIMWEVGNSKEERVMLPELQRVLRRKGYTVGVKTGANTTIKGHGGDFKTGDAANMIAVLDRPLAHLMGR